MTSENPILQQRELQEVAKTSKGPRELQEVAPKRELTTSIRSLTSAVCIHGQVASTGPLETKNIGWLFEEAHMGLQAPKDLDLRQLTGGQTLQAMCPLP